MVGKSLVVQQNGVPEDDMPDEDAETGADGQQCFEGGAEPPVLLTPASSSASSRADDMLDEKLHFLQAHPLGVEMMLGHASVSKWCSHFRIQNDTLVLSSSSC